MLPDQYVSWNHAVRRCYQEKWGQVQKLFQEWLKRRSDTREECKIVSAAVETIVDHTDARMRCVSAYKKRLRVGVRFLLQHIEALVDELPGAVAINRKAYAVDPMVNAIFVNREEIGKIFGHARELSRYFSSEASNGLSEAYAILVVTKREKNTFGVALQGKIVVRDVQQTTASFTDHEVLAPRSTEQQVREVLKETLMKDVAAYLHASLPRVLLRTTRSPRNEQLFCSGIDLKNPASYLEDLTATLSRPNELLRLRQTRLRISKLGVVVPQHDTVAVNDILCNEVSVGVLPTRIFTLVRYPKDEMLPT